MTPRETLAASYTLPMSEEGRLIKADKALAPLLAAGIRLVQRRRLGDVEPTAEELDAGVVVRFAAGGTAVCNDLDHNYWYPDTETGSFLCDPSDEYVLLSDLFPEGR